MSSSGHEVQHRMEYSRDQSPFPAMRPTKRSWISAFVWPLLLFVGFASLSSAVFWRQSRIVDSLDQRTFDLGQALKPVSPTDALAFAESPSDVSVDRLTDDFYHISSRLEGFPGHTTVNRLDLVMDDYVKAQRELANRGHLTRGGSPVGDSIAKLLAVEKRACEMGQVVYFPLGSHGLTPAAREIIRGSADRWRTTPEATVDVEGFADDATGTDEVNGPLSDARAQEVKEYLRTLIDPVKVVARGRGSHQIPTYQGFVASDPEYRRVAVIQVRH
jgi:outer membrane protein OmpA-like peptidoglycan-associated protein